MYINLKNLYKKAVEIAPYLSSELVADRDEDRESGESRGPRRITINISVAERQEVLEKIDLKERLKKVTDHAQQGARNAGALQQDTVPHQRRASTRPRENTT